MRWVERTGIRWLEAGLPGAIAAFTTRLGGVSDPPFDSLNLGFAPPDAAAAVTENRNRLASALGVSVADVLCARQVHGVELHEHRARPQDPPFASPAADRPLPEADAQVAAERGALPLVFVADCLPVALTAADGPSGAGRVAMVHCGWRPLAGGILERVVRATGASAAAIGPGIGPCCYEVGDDVRRRFEHLAGPGGPVARGGNLDLPEVAERLLRRCGIEQIDRADLCTSCNEELFFSHRRDGGSTGRQAGLVWFD